MTKRALDQAGISMPDEAREVVFPGGVPVQMLDEARQLPPQGSNKRIDSNDALAAHSAEGALSSEVSEINQQVKNSRPPEEGENLLSTDPSPAEN